MSDPLLSRLAAVARGHRLAEIELEETRYLLRALTRLEREARAALPLLASLGVYPGPLRAALDDLTALHQRAPMPAPAPRKAHP